MRVMTFSNYRKSWFDFYFSSSLMLSLDVAHIESDRHIDTAQEQSNEKR